jgi:hypothetical protein
MVELHLASTANRSVVGIINEFGYLADASREDFAARSGRPVGPPRSHAIAWSGAGMSCGVLNTHAGDLMRRNAVRIGPLRV